MILNASLNAILLSLALAVCAGGSRAAANDAEPVQRDWQKFPAIVEIDTTENVFAIGDAHADPKRLARLLAAARLTGEATTDPDKVKWIAGKSVLVIVGDLIEKGPDSLGVISLLRALQDDAQVHGGQVIITLGNFEGEFLADPGGKKTRNFARELEAKHLDPGRIGACRDDLGRFLCDLPFGVRVNDWFFSHAGNTDGRSLAELDAAIRTGIERDGFKAKESTGAYSLLEARLNAKGPNGLPWFYAGRRTTEPKELLQGYADHLGVKHLVQGHQYEKVQFPDGERRNEQTLFQRYGILFLIDSGMSRGIGGSSRGGALRIARVGDDEEAVVICADGERRTLWDSRRNQDIKEQHCGK